jgi:hypothetical protein
MTLPGRVAFHRPRIAPDARKETTQAGEALSDSVRVLLISASTRNGSANTAALVTAAALWHALVGHPGGLS